MNNLESKKVLNIGCGGKHVKGAVNLDWLSGYLPLSPDVIHDLNVIPYPFPDDSFDLVIAHHILEHLEKPFEVMKELARIIRKDGELHIKVPHFSRGFTHAEHCHGFDVTFPLYFNKDFAQYGYYGVDYKLKTLKLRWHAFPGIAKHLSNNIIVHLTLSTLDQLFTFLANLSPSFCSRIWCYLVGGFEEIEFLLINKKQ